jgi:hypothetical protein
MSSLAEQPPPRRGAKLGYYPDPLGSGRARWWDGAAWTHRIGPAIEADAASGKPVSPPTKRCRHCGAESETFADACPNCGRGYGTGPGVIAAIIAGAVVALLLLLAGCGLLVAAVVDEVDDEIDERSITQAEFRSVPLNSTESQVRAALGTPIRESETKRGGECLYYAREGQGLFDINDFKLCFRDGALVSKSAD